MRALGTLAGVGLALLTTSTASAEETVRVCIGAGDGWGIYDVYASRAPDGTPALGAGRPAVGDLPRARGLAWFETGEPVIHKGWTYRKVGEPEPETWVLGRYNRFKPPYRGAPMMEPLGGEDRVLLVLAEPVGCLFQRYVRDPDPRASGGPGG